MRSFSVEYTRSYDDSIYIAENRSLVLDKTLSYILGLWSSRPALKSGVIDVFVSISN